MSDLVILREPQTILVVQDPQTLVVSAPGPQGPQGEPGENVIGGYAVAVEDLANGDVLSFTGTAWSNRRQETLSDGGNF